MNKSLIFLSHIEEEKDIAIAFKDLIESNFLGMVEVFAFSDDRSIPLGQKWLDDITEALKKCSIEIILCSPSSVLKPWIHFEAGVGWMRDIPVIPLCHSGMEPSKLPIPLNLLQATVVSEVSGLKSIFSVLASVIGSKVPKVDFADFITKVKEFEQVYTFWDKCNENFSLLKSIEPKIIDALKMNKTIKIELNEIEIQKFKSMTPFFTSNNIFQLKNTGDIISIKTNGTYYDYEIVPMSNLQKILSDPHLKIF